MLELFLKVDEAGKILVSNELDTTMISTTLFPLPLGYRAWQSLIEFGPFVICIRRDALR